MSIREPLPDAEMTLVVKDEMISMHYGRLPKSRLTWRAPGISFFVKGSLSQGRLTFESAGNLCVQECLARHIPAISLRLQTTKSSARDN